MNLVAFSGQSLTANPDLAPCLDTGAEHHNCGIHVVAFQEAQTGCREYDTAGTLRAGGPGHDPVGTRIREGLSVRRLTPRECERLQGFPDDYTLIPYRGKSAADGPRYKALGNSMAVPVMRWIGERIARVDAIAGEAGTAGTTKIGSARRASTRAEGIAQKDAA
jgi:DNA (cytosine-5)-methyltransferase 1